jgi:fructose-bisphosphate aldolase class I
MNRPMLVQTAQALVGNGRGLLAMDESNGTCNKRFAAAGIPQTEDARRAYRELIVTTPRLGRCVSGAILYDETIRQHDSTGVLLLDRLVEAGIIPGIKVDRGAKPLALHSGETVTEGLDGLRERLAEYAAMGARFAKWRGVISLGDGRPSRGLPGGRPRPHRRAGGADDRQPWHRTMRGRDGSRPARRVRGADNPGCCP